MGRRGDAWTPHTFYRDTTRTVLARNDSPDIGYDVSLNPYRGCKHGCVYCLSGDTPILMGDGTTKPLSKIRVGDTVYGTVRRGWYRRYVKTQVLNHWRAVKPAYEVTLEDGTSLVSSGDHRFLTERGWKFVTGVLAGKEERPYLTLNNKLMGVGALVEPRPVTQDLKKATSVGLLEAMDTSQATPINARGGRTAINTSFGWPSKTEKLWSGGYVST